MEDGAVEIWEDEALATELAPKRDEFFTVAINLCDRAYCGPEEGGWYYDLGEPSESARLARWLKVFTDEKAAEAYAHRLDSTICKRANKGRRSMYSVLSEGEYRAIVHDGYPAAWPAEKPHYE